MSKYQAETPSEKGQPGNEQALNEWDAERIFLGRIL